MTKQEFLKIFSADVLQLDYTADEYADLQDLPEWDSLAQLTTISFFDKELNLKLTFKELEVVDTIHDLLIKANIA